MGGIAVIGAGGHAKVVVATLQAVGLGPLLVLDDDPARWGSALLGVEVAGPVASLADRGLERAVLAIGDNRTRQRLAESLGPARWVTAIHPETTVHPSARIGEGSVVFAGVVVQPDVVVGAHAILNTGSTADHDTRIGDFAHVAPGAHLAGGVEVGAGAFLGIGSCAVPGARIGAWATVGAGGVVISEVAAGETVVGVPARPRKRAP